MSHLLAGSRGASISDHDAKDVIEQVRTAVDRCRILLKKRGYPSPELLNSTNS